MKTVFLLCMLVLSASAAIQLRSSVRYSDLQGNDHLNNLLANTLINKKGYLEGMRDSLKDLPMHFEYRFFEVKPSQTTQMNDLLTAELGGEFNLNSEEIESLAKEGFSEQWNTYIYLEALTSGVVRPTVVLVRWDKFQEKYDGHILRGQKDIPSTLTKNILIRYTSLFGTEPNDPTLLSEIETSEMNEAYAVARTVLLSSFDELARIRGVDPKNPKAEVEYKNYLSPHKGLGVDPITMIIAAAAVVKLAAKVWQIFASVFATKVKTELIGEFQSKGFSQYAMTASVRRYMGIKAADLDKFTTVVTRILTGQHPDANKQKKIKANIAMVSMIENNAWTMDDVALDTANGSQDRIFTIMSNMENYGEKYNFMAMNVETSFKLAPNLLIYKQTKSVFGGIFGSEKMIINEVPRTVTSEEIEIFRTFNLVMACKLFNDNFESTDKFNFPPFPKV